MINSVQLIQCSILVEVEVEVLEVEVTRSQPRLRQAAS